MQMFNNNQQIYTTAEIARITGFSIRQIGYWATQGIIVPSIQFAQGSGSRRVYSFDDLLQFRFIRQLRKYGWSLQKIREAITRLKEIMNDPNSFQKAVLVHGSKTILAICKTKEGERIILDVLNPSGQQVMWIFMDLLREETQLAAKTFSSDEDLVNATQTTNKTLSISSQ